MIVGVRSRRLVLQEYKEGAKEHDHSGRTRETRSVKDNSNDPERRQVLTP
uniref:Uncharacterized protein n=1 Tax=Arundo donax TaxID=35708 RepID=A0A0A9HFS3_ARUDO